MHDIHSIFVLLYHEPSFILNSQL